MPLIVRVQIVVEVPLGDARTSGPLDRVFDLARRSATEKLLRLLDGSGCILVGSPTVRAVVVSNAESRP